MPLLTPRTRMTVLLTALCAVVMVVPAVPPPASTVVTDQAYPVPAGGVFTVRGHGFGHGHGMSQYGAWGAAKQGRTHRQILRFYYPGTSWGTVTGRVRVLLTADTTRDVVVGVAEGLTVRDLGSGASYRLPQIAGVDRWRLNVDGTRTVVGYHRKSGWTRWLPGGRLGLEGDGQLSAAGPLTLWTPSGQRTYRGALRAASPSAGSADRDTVNVVPMDHYVRGVIPAEMPASWHAEAVRAQAVAARTYATWSRDQRLDRHWQICDTTSCQVYRGIDAEDERANAAVTATARQILTAGGTAAFTQFSSSSGGWTAAGSRPYLVAKADPYDDHAGNPVHDWSVRLSATRIKGAYPGLGTLRRIVVKDRDGNGEWRGRVTTLVLDGSRRDVTVSGNAFRSTFGLRSTWFRF